MVGKIGRLVFGWVKLPWVYIGKYPFRWTLPLRNVYTISEYLFGKPWHAFCIRHNLTGLYDRSVLFTGQTIQDVYQNAGFIISVKARRPKYFIVCQNWPNWWTRAKLHAEIISKVREFQLSQASEQTGLSFGDIRTDLGVCENFDLLIRRGNFSMSAQNIAKLLEISDVFGGFSVVLNPSRLALVQIEGLCKAHFISKDYRALESIVLRLGRGSGQIFHFLVCAKNRSAHYRHLTSGYQFKENINIHRARPVREKYLLRSIYNMDQLEQIAELINTGKLTRRFLDQCLLNYCVVTNPESMVLLQRMTTGEDGVQLTISEIARLFHRGIEPKYMVSIHELLQFGWLTFNQAEVLAKAGVLPELCDALDGLADKPTVDQITRLHDTAEFEGLERVMEILSQLALPEKAMSFFALSRELNGQVSDQLVLNAVQKTTSYVEARLILVGEKEITPTIVTAPQAPSRKRRRQPRIVVEEIPTTMPESATHVLEPMTYGTVMVSHLPHLNGNAWWNRFKRCGWTRVRYGSKSGTHWRIKKGPWEVFINQSGSKSASRYQIFGSLRKAMVPEEEVRLLIDDGVDRKRRNDSSVKEKVTV